MPISNPRQTVSGPSFGPPGPYLMRGCLNVSLDNGQDSADLKAGPVGEREDGLERRQGALHDPHHLWKVEEGAPG